MDAVSTSCTIDSGETGSVLNVNWGVRDLNATGVGRGVGGIEQGRGVRICPVLSLPILLLTLPLPTPFSSFCLKTANIAGMMCLFSRNAKQTYYLSHLVFCIAKTFLFWQSVSFIIFSAAHTSATHYLLCALKVIPQPTLSSAHFRVLAAVKMKIGTVTSRAGLLSRAADQ
jgi:hypothetical protein